MRKILQFAMLTFLLYTSSIYAEGFQGVPWGASIQNIMAKFPDAIQDRPSTEVFPICQHPNGGIYSCTIAQYECERTEERCHPFIRVKEYRVGSHKFEAVFSLSKDKKLNGVSLSMGDVLLGENLESVESIYITLLDALKARYGSPDVSEPLVAGVGKFGNALGKYAFYRWRNNGTQITLVLSCTFDITTRKIVFVGSKPSIDIIYSPLLSGVASKL